MGVIKREQVTPSNQADEKPEKSLYVSDERIDRKGNAWKKQTVFIRNEHLGKIKVIAHFQKKTIQDIIDIALKEYFQKHFDNSEAMQEMIKKSGYK